MPSKLQLLLELALQKKGAYGARRVQRAADEIKNLENTYSEDALKRAFLGDNAKAIMTMNPADFEKFAIPLESHVRASSMTQPEYIKHLAQLKGGFADVPFLEVGREYPEALLNIQGHEGRHRSRALASKDFEKSLVNLFPTASMRESMPRKSQEEFIEAMKKELGKERFVSPEGTGTLPRDLTHPIHKEQEERGILEVNRPQLPDIYAKGGKVSQDAMHMAVMNQKVQKKARGDLVEESIKEAKSKQEAPVNPFRMPTQKQSQYEKDFRQYLANQQAAREQVATELPSRLVRGAIPGAAGAIAGYAAQIPGTAGDIANLYQELKPESWRDLPDVVQALPTTERIQQYFLPEEKTSPELQAGITGGNIAALGQGIASLPAAAKGIAKGATAGSKALANEAAYRIHQAMTSGEGALAPMLAGVAPKKMIPAWHGSPHDIPMGRSMLMEKIGTGEGAQAYGHGLYVAEGKNVAKSYAAANKGRAAASEGWIDSLPKYKQMDVYNILQKQYPQQVKDAMLEDARLRLGEDVYAKVKERLNSSNLYKLELSHPDPAKEAATPLSPNDFLHWDLPLSQQPEHIRNAWGDFVQLSKSKNPNIKMPTVDNPNLTGASLVSGLSQSNRGGLTQNETSEFLRQRGIPGIRYLDAGSRGAGEGTYNYVLFDPKLANIVGKEKEGGVIHKAEGGITSDDLIIEENPL